LTTTGATLQRDRFQTRLDANALELFARVFEAGSFAAAGRSLGLTRAAVSGRIAAIEAQIGMPLFVRHSRALGLTETGRGLVAQAQAVLAATDAARRDLRTRTHARSHTHTLPGLQGSLRISACPSYGQGVLAPRLAAFQALHPQLRMELQFSNRPVDLARENFDVAFRMTPRPPEDCVATPVLRFAIRAWAAPTAVPVLPGPAALEQHRCLVWGASTEQLNVTWLHPQSGQRETVTLQPALCVDDLRTLVDLAAAGSGVVFAPGFAITALLERGALHEVLPGWTAQVDLGDAVMALTLANSVVPAAARALVDFVREPTTV
jgi:DNA-binding transcriptional LysR family regulator